MNCPSCGQPIESGTLFCGNCGQAIQYQQNPQPVNFVAIQRQEESTPQPSAAGAQSVAVPTVNTAAVAAVDPSAAQMQQVIANEAPAAANPSMATPALAGAQANTMAAPRPPIVLTTQPGEKLSIFALICSIIAIPGAIIVIPGLIIGAAGVICATIARGKYKHAMSLLAIIFSCVAIVASVGILVFDLSSDTKKATPVNTSGSTLQAVTTGCYSTRIDSGLTYSPSGNCSLSAKGNGEGVAVEAQNIPQLNNESSSQFLAQAKADVDQGAQENSNNIVSEGSTEFANSPAYYAIESSSSGVYLESMDIYHQTSSGDNFFSIARAVYNDTNISFGSLESDWQWN